MVILSTLSYLRMVQVENKWPAHLWSQEQRQACLTGHLDRTAAARVLARFGAEDSRLQLAAPLELLECQRELGLNISLK